MIYELEGCNSSRLPEIKVHILVLLSEHPTSEAIGLSSIPATFIDLSHFRSLTVKTLGAKCTQQQQFNFSAALKALDRWLVISGNARSTTSGILQAPTHVCMRGGQSTLINFRLIISGKSNAVYRNFPLSKRLKEAMASAHDVGFGRVVSTSTYQAMGLGSMPVRNYVHVHRELSFPIKFPIIVNPN